MKMGAFLPGPEHPAALDSRLLKMLAQALRNAV